MDGWLILHRKLGDNPLWLDEPFTRGQAWVDLLMLANHAPGFIHVQGVKISLKRGDVGKSENTLAARWKWSRGKVRRFVEELISEKMISKNSYKKTDKRKSVITICNYEIYQDIKIQNGTCDGTGDGTSDGQATDKRRTSDGTGTNNITTLKDKEEVGVPTKKRNGCSFLKPTVEDVQAYCLEKGYSVSAEKFVAHYESNGWKVGRNQMKSWHATVLKWHLGDYQGQKSQKQNSEFSTIDYGKGGRL